MERCLVRPVVEAAGRTNVCAFCAQNVQSAVLTLVPARADTIQLRRYNVGTSVGTVLRECARHARLDFSGFVLVDLFVCVCVYNPDGIPNAARMGGVQGGEGGDVALLAEAGLAHHPQNGGVLYHGKRS